MKKIFLLLTTAVALCACGNKATDELKLDYEKYSLDNGLEVVLHVDKSDPIVAVAIQYHVGSSRETLGKTGFAHLFEHMLFQRSEHLERNAFFTRIDEMGGDFNGSTSNDGTNYYECVPRDALEKILWMESDRMGFFINTVTQDGLEREIDVVSNEKRQGEEGAFGKGYGILVRNFYPEGHPYSWPVIGMISDLKRSTVDDVKAFYDKYYSPSNATLVIAGDFDVDGTKALVEKYFGEIKAHGDAGQVEPQPVVLDSDKVLYYTDNYANTAELDIMYPAVEQYNPDSYALRILAMLLSNGQSSPFYQVLVSEDKVASGFNVAYQALERAGAISVSASAYQDVDLDDVYASIKKAFAKFETEGVNPAELERIKVLQETMTYNMTTTVLGKAMQMARANEFAGRPDQVVEDLKHYLAVTAEDVMRVYEKYVKGQKSFTLCGVPVAQPELAIEGAEQVFPVADNMFEDSLSSKGGAIVDQQDYEFTPSAFDRSVEPGLLSNTPKFTMPQMWNTTLGNGATLKGIVYKELPVTYFSIIFNNGKMNDPADKIGTAYMTAAVMNKGTANKTPEELSSELGRLGASAMFGLGDEYFFLSGHCLSKNLDKTIALVKEMILEPRWDEEQMETIRKIMLQSLQDEETEPSYIANNVFSEVIYGKGTRLATRMAGNEETIKSLTVDDLKAFYNANMFYKNVAINYVGGLTAAQAKKAFAPLAEAWKLTDDAPVINNVEPTEEKTHAKVYFADFPGAAQSYIILGRKGMPQNDADYYETAVVNNELGGSSAGILFKVLRLQNGYTYGAYSRVSSKLFHNSIRAYSSVQSAYTVPSMDFMRDILTTYEDDFTQETLDKTKNTLLRSNLSKYESPSNLDNILESIAIYGLADNYIEQRQQELESMTLDEAKVVIEKWFNYDDMIFVIVGDAKTQLPAIKAAGFDVEFVER